MLDILNKKNTVAVEQALKSIDSKIIDLMQRVNGLNNSMSSLHQRLEQLELINMKLRAKSVGHGATE